MPGIIDKLLSGGISEAVNSVGSVIDNLTTSDEERAKAKKEITEVISTLSTNIAESQKEVLVTEMQGNWLQKSWRPILMLAFGFIICYRYFLGPTFHLPVADLPVNFWNLLEVGLGGYVIGRSAEKIVTSVTDNMDKLPGKKA